MAYGSVAEGRATPADSLLLPPAWGACDVGQWGDKGGRGRMQVKGVSNLHSPTCSLCEIKSDVSPLGH